MTKRIEKKRLKKRHGALMLSAWMHNRAVESWKRVVEFATSRPVTTESAFHSMVSGIFENQAKEASIMVLVEASRATDCIVGAACIEQMSGKWIPKRWAA